MSEQTLDLRRSLQILRRHYILIGVFAALGLFAGAGYAVLNPPMLASTALVALPPSNHEAPTQVLIAGSNPVLSRALRSLDSPVSLQAIRSRVQVKSLTPNVLSISAKGKTAAQAERTTNAVANSYVAYVRAANSAVGPVQAQLVEAATSATGMSVPGYLLVTAGPGVLLGVLIGAIVALAISRRDRRLRERDEIANAIGVPVLASIPVGHPADAGRWTKLLEDYEPSVVHAWQLRNAMRYLRQTDVISANGSNGNGFSLAVLSLSSARGALALGPQLAVFAASLGIPTTLVIDPQQDANALAQLRAACAAPPSSRRSSKLQVAVTDDHHGGRQPAGALVGLGSRPGRDAGVLSPNSCAGRGATRAELDQGGDLSHDRAIARRSDRDPRSGWHWPAPGLGSGAV